MLVNEVKKVKVGKDIEIGGDGSYERKEYIEKSSVKIEDPDNL